VCNKCLKNARCKNKERKKERKAFRRKLDPGAFGIQVQTFCYLVSVLRPPFSVRKIRKLKQTPSETGRFLLQANMYKNVSSSRYSWTNPLVVRYLTTLYQREVEVKLSPTMPWRKIHDLHQRSDLGTHSRSGYSVEKKILPSLSGFEPQIV